MTFQDGENILIAYVMSFHQSEFILKCASKQIVGLGDELGGEGEELSG